MNFSIDGKTVYAYTGGRPLDPGPQPPQPKPRPRARHRPRPQPLDSYGIAVQDGNYLNCRPAGAADFES